MSRKRPGQGGRRQRRVRARTVECQTLESRTLLTAVPGYDYVLTGQSWPDPAYITYSIAPDGVNWDNGVNVLNATFNARFGWAGAWQYQLARALATWESVANINISPTTDGPYPFNTSGLAQGDPRFGDIRFGGYPFPDDSTMLAQTYFPPPDGATAAGDVEINTSMDFGIGSGYDLYSVILHETGHSLGLNHPQNPAEVMYPTYEGVRAGLAPGDIAGIQAIYGARALDGYQEQGLGFSAAIPIDLSSKLASSSQTSISNASLPFIGTAEYYGFVAPPSSNGSVQATVSSAGLSMLSPEVSIFDGSGKLLARASNPSSWSDAVTAVASGMSAGQRYIVEVTGATDDVFSVGTYALTVSLLNSTPSLPPAQQTTPPGASQQPVSTGPAPDRFEPNNTPATATALGRITQDTVSGVNLATGSDVDYFAFQTGTGGVYQVSAQGVIIQAYTSRGRLITQGGNHLTLRAARKGMSYLVKIMPPSNAPVSSYTLSIVHPGSQAAVRKLTRPHPRPVVARTARSSILEQARTSSAAHVTAPAGTMFAWPTRWSPPWHGWRVEVAKRVAPSHLMASTKIW
ncbi:MAG: matrixin family metalloprotease [Isosphaeraceae bacterium]